jgi:serine protease Do
MRLTCDRSATRSLTTLVIVGLMCTTVRSSEGLPRTVEELPSLEKSLHELYAQVAPSTVNLFVEPKHEHVGSGVVIDAKGLVLTHAHHGQAPGTRFSVGLAPGTGVTAVFPDGKKAQGKFLGVHEPFDLSFVELEGGGPWPAVPVGEPARLKPGDPCVMLGYPKMHHREGEPPLLRLGRFLGPWGHYLLTSCNLNGGDSGGPLFTLDGKLLGNNNLCPTQGGDRGGHGTGHTSVEYFQRIRPLLLEGRHVKRLDFRFNAPSGKYDYPISGPFDGVAGLERLVTPARNWVLTVLDENKPVALGVVVDPDGWVVTKASELPVGDVECRLSDGRKVKAVIAGRDRDHDLALLHLPISNLPAAKWTEQPLAVGQTLAAVGAAPQPLAVGIVACAARSVPGQPGVLAFDVAAVAPSGAGVRVTAIQPSRPRMAAVLKPGDLIKRVEETPTPDLAAFAAAIGELLRGPGGRPGERVWLMVVRDSREFRIAAPVEAAYVRPWSSRHDGFPAAFVFDGVVLRNECGGPLMGTDGKVAGLAVARIGPEKRAVLTPSDSRTYAIPAPVVMKVVAELRRKHLENAGGKVNRKLEPVTMQEHPLPASARSEVAPSFHQAAKTWRARRRSAKLFESQPSPRGRHDRERISRL